MTHGHTTLDPASMPGDPAAVVASVDPARLRRHVEVLAASPRNHREDPDAVTAATAHVHDTLHGLGHAPVRVEAEVDGLSAPAWYVDVEPAAPAATPTVVLMAHLDTVPGSPGADDNASGVAAVLELARVLPRGALPARIVLAVVPFEESYDLAGSTALAAALMRRPDVDLTVAISAEMVGFGTTTPRLAADRGDDLFLVGYPDSAEAIDTVCAAARAVGAGPVRGLAVPHDLPEIGRSDHAAFHRIGVPALMATDGAEFRNPHYHRPSDVPQTLDEGFLARSTGILAAGVMALAAPDRGRPTLSAGAAAPPPR